MRNGTWHAYSIELTQMREMLILRGTQTFTREVIFNLNLKGRKDSQLCSGNCRVWHIGKKTASKEQEVIPLDKQKPDYERHQLSQTLFSGAPKSLQMVTAAMKLKDAYSLEGKLCPQKFPDIWVALEGNTEGPGTASSEPLLPS